MLMRSARPDARSGVSA